MLDKRESSFNDDDVVRIVRDVTCDAALWVGRGQDGTKPLMDGLAKAIDADIWNWVYSWIGVDDDMPKTIKWANSDGVPIRVAMGYIFRYLLGIGGTDPASPALKGGALRGEHFTISRAEACGEEQWTNSWSCRFFKKQFGLEDTVHSIIPLERREDRVFFCGVGLSRRLGRPLFTPREIRIVHLVVEKMPWLREIHQQGAKPHDWHEFKPYLRPYVPLMIAGLSVKDIAQALPNTTEETVKTMRKRVLKAANVENVQQLAAKYSTGRFAKDWPDAASRD